MRENYKFHKCCGCGNKMTWAEMKVQFGRFMRKRLEKLAGKRSAYCQKCNTKLIKAINKNWNKGFVEFNFYWNYSREHPGSTFEEARKALLKAKYGDILIFTSYS